VDLNPTPPGVAVWSPNESLELHPADAPPDKSEQSLAVGSEVWPLYDVDDVVVCAYVGADIVASVIAKQMKLRTVIQSVLCRSCGMAFSLRHIV
jgi:hypothetical protein